MENELRKEILNLCHGPAGHLPFPFPFPLQFLYIPSILKEREAAAYADLWFVDRDVSTSVWVALCSFSYNWVLFLFWWLCAVGDS